jgi:hypothetical protein
MIGKPLMAHESEMRSRVVSVSPRQPLGENAHDSDAQNDPHNIHRCVPPWMLFVTLRE